MCAIVMVEKELSLLKNANATVAAVIAIIAERPKKFVKQIFGCQKSLIFVYSEVIMAARRAFVNKVSKSE